jgi:hypothetical protein
VDEGQSATISNANANGGERTNGQSSGINPDQATTEVSNSDAPTGVHFPGSHLTLANYDRKFGFRKHAFRGFKDVNVDGKTAEVGILLHNQVYDADLLLKVRLNQIDSQWEVTRLENFPEFVMSIAKLQMSGASDQSAAASQRAR